MFWKKRIERVERPLEIQIETTNRCNAKCEFCHHRNMKRGLTDMSDELFLKLLKDLKEINPENVHPFANGEMFLDKKIFDRLDLINHELPAAGIVVFTNGFLLDEERAEKLSRIRNIRLINFSLNGFEPLDYKRRVGLDFKRVVANIKNVLRLNSERKFAENIIVASVEHGKEDKVGNKIYNDSFCVFCRQNFPGAEIKVGYKYNYISRIFSFRGFKDIHCQRLKNMVVLANGLVALCCMDMEGEYILGNANDRSLLDIYNGALAREYRKNKKSRMLPCRFCNMI
ncbi:MAG: radical SAM protein [Candidatus Omnitrophica bacterium]|nr:radical SAM protein [Candidatus Omnitrophota bacterium]